MNTVTITIKDVEDRVEVEGHIEKDALDKPPTAALVIGTYISTNINTIAENAIAWFKEQVESEAEQGQQRLFAPREQSNG